MAKIYKTIDQAVPRQERTITFDESEASAGDILMVEESLGRTGGAISIGVDLGSALKVKFNTLQTIYPTRELDTSFMYTQGDPNVSLPREIIAVDGIAEIELGSGESWTMKKEFPIRTIEVAAASGTWSILIT